MRARAQEPAHDLPAVSARVVASAAASGRGRTAMQVRALQRTAGNAAVGRVLARERRRSIARQPLATEPAAMTRAQEIAASRRSEGEVTSLASPPTISLYAFAIDDATLKPRHRALLAELADVLPRLPSGAVTVMVIGHADASGEPRVNDPLSARRAAAVAHVLGRLHGVRVDTAWRGESEPVATGDTVESRARNRRVDLVLLPAQPLGRRPRAEDHGGRPEDAPPQPADRWPEDDEQPDRRVPQDDEPPEHRRRDPSWCERHPIICGLPIIPPFNPLWLCLLDPAVCVVIPVIPVLPKGPEPPGGDDPPRDREPDEPDPPRVSIGLVRHPDTPDDMYDRVPPRVTTTVSVTVTGRRPDMPPIVLTVIGGGGRNGVALVDGDVATELVTTGTVDLEGTVQTEVGHRGGALRLVATMGATVLAESNYFAVSAIPLLATASYVRPIDDGTFLGMLVDNAWSSDSTEVSDLDKVQVWELVETQQTDGCFADHPPTSRSPRAVAGDRPPVPDQHGSRISSLNRPGTLDNQQVLKFEDRRSGSYEVPMEASGFGIRREVRAQDPALGLELETRKEGRTGSAEGMTSEAGETDPDPIVEIQPIPARGDGGRPPPKPGGAPAPGGDTPGGVPSAGEVTPRPFHGTVVGTFVFGYVDGLPPAPQPGTTYPVRISFESRGALYTAVVGFEVRGATATHVELESTNTEPIDVAPESHPPRVLEAHNPAAISYVRLRGHGS